VPACLPKRTTPARGLLAGLLALIVFASFAVAMTVHGPSGATQATATQTVLHTGDGDGDRSGHHR
jgi:hypothetical protein